MRPSRDVTSPRSLKRYILILGTFDHLCHQYPRNTLQRACEGRMRRFYSAHLLCTRNLKNSHTIAGQKILDFEISGACFSADMAKQETSCSLRQEPSEHVQAAWKHWRKLGAPKYIVAPMVDQVMLSLSFMSETAAWLRNCKQPRPPFASTSLITSRRTN
jgi:hypothetical protein